MPSCSNTDQGDDGLLNPIRNGLAIRNYQPWTTAPPGRRPARCTNDPNQFPSFLRFDRMTSEAAVFREEFACNAYPLGERVAAWSSKFPRVGLQRAGGRTTSMMAGNAHGPQRGLRARQRLKSLSIVMLTDSEEDGSTTPPPPTPSGQSPAPTP